MRGLFVTGTDTGVGKTWVSAAIVRSLVAEGRRVGALKPIATSGARGPDGSLVTADASVLRDALRRVGQSAEGGATHADRVEPNAAWVALPAAADHPTKRSP